jgi:hypothetical protein
MPNAGSNIDHDDGSAYWNDSYNVLVGGGGWIKHPGPFEIATHNIWVAPEPSSAFNDWGLCAVNVGASPNTPKPSNIATGPFTNNSCIGHWEGIGELGLEHGSVRQNPRPVSGGNRFYTPTGVVKINGNLSLERAQEGGLERDSSEEGLGSLSMEELERMVRELLGFL